MGQTGSGNDGPDFVQASVGQLGVEAQQGSARRVAERTAYARYFQTVCQAVVNKDAAGKREDLRLVL